MWAGSSTTLEAGHIWSSQFKAQQSSEILSKVTELVRGKARELELMFAIMYPFLPKLGLSFMLLE